MAPPPKKKGYNKMLENLGSSEQHKSR